MNLIKIYFKKIKISVEAAGLIIEIKTDYSLFNLIKEYNSRDSDVLFFNINKEEKKLEDLKKISSIQIVFCDSQSFSEMEEYKNLLTNENNTNFQITFDKNDFYLELSTAIFGISSPEEARRKEKIWIHSPDNIFDEFVIVFEIKKDKKPKLTLKVNKNKETSSLD